MNKAVFTVFFCGGIVKKHEIIGLLIILIISTVYSFTLPETSLNEIESDPQVKIIVEGKYNETLVFNSSLIMFMDLIKKLFWIAKQFFISL